MPDDDDVLVQPSGPDGAAPPEPKITVEIADEPESQPETPVAPAELIREPVAADALQSLSPSEDELQRYSADVRKRIKQLDWRYHEERRRTEATEQRAQALERQMQAAMGYAVAVAQQNELLKRATVANHQAAQQATAFSADAQMAAAKERIRKAHEAGDTDALIAAQTELANWAAQKQFMQFAPKFNEASIPTIPPPQPEQPAAAQPSQRDLRWHRENPWFGSDPRMTRYAQLIDEELTGAGHQPGSEEYYTALDNEMAERFPERLRGTRGASPQRSNNNSSSNGKGIVAPVSRMNDRIQPNGSVRLSASQLEIARKLGLTPEQYAQGVVQEIQKEKDRGRY